MHGKDRPAPAPQTSVGAVGAGLSDPEEQGPQLCPPFRPIHPPPLCHGLSLTASSGASGPLGHINSQDPWGTLTAVLPKRCVQFPPNLAGAAESAEPRAGLLRLPERQPTGSGRRPPGGVQVLSSPAEPRRAQLVFDGPGLVRRFHW